MVLLGRARGFDSDNESVYVACKYQDSTKAIVKSSHGINETFDVYNSKAGLVMEDARTSIAAYLGMHGVLFWTKPENLPDYVV